MTEPTNYADVLKRATDRMMDELIAASIYDEPILRAATQHDFGKLILELKEFCRNPHTGLDDRRLTGRWQIRLAMLLSLPHAQRDRELEALAATSAEGFVSLICSAFGDERVLVKAAHDRDYRRARRLLQRISHDNNRPEEYCGIAHDMWVWCNRQVMMEEEAEQERQRLHGRPA